MCHFILWGDWCKISAGPDYIPLSNNSDRYLDIIQSLLEDILRKGHGP